MLFFVYKPNRGCLSVRGTPSLPDASRYFASATAAPARRTECPWCAELKILVGSLSDQVYVRELPSAETAIYSALHKVAEPVTVVAGVFAVDPGRAEDVALGPCHEWGFLHFTCGACSLDVQGL